MTVMLERCIVLLVFVSHVSVLTRHIDSKQNEFLSHRVLKVFGQ